MHGTGGTTADSDALDELARSGSERFEAAMAANGPRAAHEAAIAIEAARRVTSNRYLAWLSLTEEYLFAERGHGGRVEAASPERIAEVARRSGFDAEELALASLMSEGPVNPIGEAMAGAAREGDRDALRAAWQRGERLQRRIHDFRCDLLSDRLGAIYRRHGAKELEAAMRFAAERGSWRSSMPTDLALEPRRRLRELTFFLSVCAYFRIRLEDEGPCWRIDVLECGRCGRQCRDRYWDPDWKLEVVDEPGPITFGRPPMTVYQTHLAVIHHMFAIDEFGAPWPVFDCRGVRPDATGCKIYLYQDPAATPAEIYAAVGRTKLASVATK